MNLLAAYDRVLQRRPILVKTLTSAALFGLGDLMSQQLEGKLQGGGLDTQRLGRMIIWGGAFAPLAHFWYGALDKMIPGKGALVVASKVAADQLTWTPVINTAFFFSTTFMATGNVEASTQQVVDKLWPTLKVNWVVWPVLQTINMAVVPLQYRLLYVNFCSLFWSAYLSNMAAAPATAVQEVKTGA